MTAIPSFRSLLRAAIPGSGVEGHPIRQGVVRFEDGRIEEFYNLEWGVQLDVHGARSDWNDPPLWIGNAVLRPTQFHAAFRDAVDPDGAEAASFDEGRLRRAFDALEAALTEAGWRALRAAETVLDRRLDGLQLKAAWTEGARRQTTTLHLWSDRPGERLPDDGAPVPALAAWRAEAADWLGDATLVELSYDLEIPSAHLRAALDRRCGLPAGAAG